MTAELAAALLLTAGFAVLVGLNDGSVLVATGPLARPTDLFGRLIVLSLAVALVPLAGAVTVSSTLAGRLSPAAGDPSLVSVGAGLVGASAVAVALHRLGRPTSLTLALVGGLAGAGLAVAGEVAWGAIATVLLLGAVAPVAAAAAAWAVRRAPSLFDRHVRVARTVGPLSLASFVLISLAYGLNDGQKAVVVPVALGAVGERGAGVSWLMMVALAFAAGAWAGSARASRSLVAGLVPIRTHHLPTARFSAAAVSLGGAVLAVPLSITQSLAAALAGSGAAGALGRVRWRAARSIVAAWAVTLPASFTVAAGIGGIALWVG